MLSLEQAMTILQKAIDAGGAQNCPIVAVVTDMSGQIIAAARMDGVGFINTEVARKKALCAVTFKLPTHEFVDAIGRDPLAKTVVMNDQTINVLPGGVPIKSGDEVVGGLGVAGGYYLQDRAIAEYAVG
jgi:glc operon protein GlcG